MSKERISLKDPWIAALLAFLIPGAGHLYQGRMFKSALYSVCILGTFLYGMALGDWKVTYYSREPGHTTYGYFSQVMVGLPALPALIQARRFASPENESTHTLDGPLSAEFTGLMVNLTEEGDTIGGAISGTVQLQPEQGDFGPIVRGTFSGTFSGSDGEQPIELELSEPFYLEKPIAASPHRNLQCDIISQNDGQLRATGRIEGGISRGVSNWFEVPMDSADLNHLNGKLGKTYELALVYTWIAGLLNILAIWDALEGPAYGYGDEEEESQTGTGEKAKTDPQTENISENKEAVDVPAAS